MTDVPNLTELLANAPTNWGKWGPDDEVGSLNYLTPASVLQAISHVTSGEVHTLQRLIGDPKGDPVWPGRSPAEREMVMDESIWDREDAPQFPGGLHYADDKIEAFLQGSTQYDALGHVWYDGKLWNGYDARTTVGGMDKASVEPIAQRGVVGTGVLLDMARHFGVEAMEAKHTFDHADLLACAERQGVTIDKRDILLIRTNHLQLFFEQGESFYEDFCEPGLEYSPELVQWFADMEIPNLVTDTIANEVTMDPSTGAALVLHNALMRNLGIAFTEICDLESLAEACDREGRYKFCYIAAPLKIHRATGSPVNPIALL
ncbi:cyclase family protein [Brevibacterium luteolum]|uniref:cyclase family protein n=1 Tax=Brevibacterium luteolum TaxID=199591 RepID=UPI00223C4C95|nr:cyclase family protein [Brevibacterium luteolum]MCT1872272.1 cyclase family protein [Brevibacterium luteolum]MCT1889519.1 cyclase family protein [Brevibacterium luteolum]MCT1892077.1 cyclase family protein [Brevibacterium luteolum]MCT1922842.1 cyclase family protein [Brevibacterium luteolum]